MWELFTSFTFSMKGHTSGLAQSQFHPFYKLHVRFLRLRKFRLVILNTRGVMFNSFTPCLLFVGRWQTVQIQIRLHITKVVSDQVLRCCSARNLNKKEKHQNNTPKLVMSSSKRLRWETPFDMYG